MKAAHQGLGPPPGIGLGTKFKPAGHLYILYLGSNSDVLTLVVFSPSGVLLTYPEGILKGYNLYAGRPVYLNFEYYYQGRYPDKYLVRYPPSRIWGTSFQDSADRATFAKGLPEDALPYFQHLLGNEEELLPLVIAAATSPSTPKGQPPPRYWP